jgi:DNA end-binding protein Ku
MARPVKSTTLSFGLVNVPVGLCKVSGSGSRVGFKLASPAGNPVKQTYVDEVTGELVGSNADCERGIFDGDGFHPVDKDTISAIDEALAIDGIEIQKCIPLSEVPFERITGAYFLQPGGKTGPAVAKALRLVYDALASTGTAGIGRLALRTEHRPFVVRAQDGALVVNTLEFASDFAKGYAEAGEVLTDVEPTDAKTLALAETLVGQLSGSIADLDGIVNEREDRRSELVVAALNGEAITVEGVAAEPVSDLTDLLTASLGQVAAKKGAAQAAEKKGAKTKAA